MSVNDILSFIVHLISFMTFGNSNQFLTRLGSEFVNPQPETTNHFSGIHVYHTQSGVIHVDDTIDIAFGVMAFHPSLVTVGI
jgi:hypothetical protein